MGGLEALALGLAAGVAAGLLDYAYAAGFGLAAGVILAGLAGLDPRSVVAASALAEALSIPLAYAAHLREGNITGSTQGRPLLLAAAATASSLGAGLAFTRLEPRGASLLYAALLAGLAAAALAYAASEGRRGPRDPPGHPALAASALAVAAGAYKALVGGYGFLMVWAQRILGAKPREAVALAAPMKLPLLALLAGLYWAGGYMDLGLAVGLLVGGLLAAAPAAKLLGGTPERGIPVLVAALAVAGAVARLAWALATK